MADWQGRAGQGSFLQPYRSAPTPLRIPTDPLRSTRPHPRVGSGDGITRQNAETRGKAKRLSFVTAFSHRLVPVVSVIRSSTAVLAALRRHSDTCTSASNTFTNTLQIIRDGPTLLTQHAPPSTE